VKHLRGEEKGMSDGRNIPKDPPNQAFATLTGLELAVLRNASGGLNVNQLVKYLRQKLDPTTQHNIKTHIESLKAVLKMMQNTNPEGIEIDCQFIHYSAGRNKSGRDKMTRNDIQVLIETLSMIGVPDTMEAKAQIENAFIMMDALARGASAEIHFRENFNLEFKNRHPNNQTADILHQLGQLHQEENPHPTPSPVMNISDDQLNLGRMYIQLIRDASNVSGLPFDKVQFNFCVKDKSGALLSLESKEIQAAIDACLAKGDEITKNLTNEQKKFLSKIALPSDPTKLHDYKTTLTLRGESFCDAAIMIINKSSVLDTVKKATCDRLSDLKKKYTDNINEGLNLSDKQYQAYYDSLLDVLKAILKESLPKEDEKGEEINDKKISTYLGNAENILNIKENKPHITISGKFNTDSSSKNLDGVFHLQIEEPLNRFCDLSRDQQREWSRAYYAYKVANKDFFNYKNISLIPNTPEMKKSPNWFNDLPEFEKKYWIDRMKAIFEDGNDQVPMGPVVRKGGIPGMRNLALSSFATFKYENSVKPIISVTPKSVRSSNLVVQNKEGRSELNPDEKRLTKMNVMQVNDIYTKMNKIKESTEEHELSDHPFPWTYAQNQQKYTPHTLYQTLLRLRGGGDDNILKHKNEAIDESKDDNLTKFHKSNHCIGTPRKISGLVHWGMHVLGANTRDMKHVREPVLDFIEYAVKPPTDTVHGKIKEIYELASKGKLATGELETKIKESNYLKSLNKECLPSFTRVMLALNDYARINIKLTSYKKKYQLHMAALEEIIYQDTGNRVQSSCKSGKDREGVSKCYRNAMRAYFNENGSFPPAEQNAKGRNDFIKIFVELFKTHHQARLAEFNAQGCEGQKALLNILPTDILNVIKASEPELLKTHAKNSALNDLGKSKVIADQEIYENMKNIFSGQSESESDHEAPRQHL
jgi:hypothetical protein